MLKVLFKLNDFYTIHTDYYRDYVCAQLFQSSFILLLLTLLFPKSLKNMAKLKLGDSLQKTFTCFNSKVTLVSFRSEGMMLVAIYNAKMNVKDSIIAVMSSLTREVQIPFVELVIKYIF